MRTFLFTTTLAVCLQAQVTLTPVIQTRGVVNAFTQAPAPSAVAPGGILWINGLNLGPVTPVRVLGTDLPTSLGDPPVTVLVNGTPVPLLSISSARIVAQVPGDAVVGVAEVIVRRGEIPSRAARFLIDPAAPSIRALNDAGFGEAAGVRDASLLTLQASGLIDPGTVSVYVDGAAAAAEVGPAPDRGAEFDIKIAIPSGAQNGDVITVRADGRVANRLTNSRASTIRSSYVRLAEGTPELRGLSGSDLRGLYLFGSAARGNDGCWPTYLFDLRSQSQKKVESCITSGNNNEVVPVVAAQETAAMAALIGPPEGQAPAGVSSRVMIFSPDHEDTLLALPAAATNLNSFGGGGLTAQLAGGGAVAIDPETGTLREAEQVGGGFLIPNLGSDLPQILSLPAQGPDGVAVLAGDNGDNPSRVRLAITSGGTVVVRDFPDGWTALLGPRAALPGGGVLPGGPGVPGGPVGPGGPGGPVGPGGPGGFGNFRATVLYHAATRMYYALAKAADGSQALIGFDAATAKVNRLPSNWFAATCTSSLPLYEIQLSGNIVVPGVSTAQSDSKNPCLARSFLELNPASGVFSAVTLSGQDQFSVGGGAQNDFIYGANGATPDALVIFDGGSSSVLTASVPSGVASFTGLTVLTGLTSAVATATRSTAGDAGLLLFDLPNAEARLLATPNGFGSVTYAGFLPVTRKIVARATRSDSSGSQFVVYDLASGDATVIANPEGVAFVGALPQATGVGGGPGIGFPPGGFPGGPGLGAAPAGLQRINAKTNTIEAIAYDGARQQVGIVGIRID